MDVINVISDLIFVIGILIATIVIISFSILSTKLGDRLYGIVDKDDSRLTLLHRIGKDIEFFVLFSILNITFLVIIKLLAGVENVLIYFIQGISLVLSILNIQLFLYLLRNYLFKILLNNRGK